MKAEIKKEQMQQTTEGHACLELHTVKSGQLEMARKK